MGKRHNRPVCNCRKFNLFQPGVRPTFLFYHNTRQNARIFCKGWGFCAYRLSVLYMAIYITLPRFFRNGAYMLVKPVPYKIPWRECEPRASHFQGGLIFPEFPTSKRKPKFTHSPKSSSFRNLSSNGVRWKFRERYMPQLQSLKIYANKNLSRSLAHMMRIYARPTFALYSIRWVLAHFTTESSTTSCEPASKLL